MNVQSNNFRDKLTKLKLLKWFKSITNIQQHRTLDNLHKCIEKFVNLLLGNSIQIEGLTKSKSLDMTFQKIGSKSWLIRKNRLSKKNKQTQSEQMISFSLIVLRTSLYKILKLSTAK